MGWGVYGILIIFGAFILLLILNPNLSCFGKRVKSPFYPFFRKKRARKKTTDYQFNLGDENGKPREEPEKNKAAEKAEDYGFRLD
jgi:hypothetical protein